MKRTGEPQKGRRVAGVREAKARFSALIRDVREGGEWIISERGFPVARLVPLDAASLTVEEWARRLEAAGELEPRRGPARPLPPPLPLERGLAQRILHKDREER
jgi:prevent-host-death family protein